MVLTGPQVPTSPPSCRPALSAGFTCPTLGRRFAGRGPASWGPTWGPAIKPGGHLHLEPCGCTARPTARSGDAPQSGDTPWIAVLQRQHNAKGTALDLDQMSGPHKAWCLLKAAAHRANSSLLSVKQVEGWTGADRTTGRLVVRSLSP